MSERQTEALEKLNRGIEESRRQVQQQTMDLARDYFSDSAEVLKQQISENRATLEDLPDQIPGGQDEGFQTLFRELMDNYSAMEECIDQARENVANLDTERLGREAEIAATDAARREAQELGVDLTEIEGTGADGRIIVSDVVEASKEAAKRRADELGVDISQLEGSGSGSGGLVTVKDVEAAGGADEQATEQAGEAAGQAQETAGQAVDQAGGVANQATDQARQVAGQAQDAAGQAMDQAGRAVQGTVGGLVGGGQQQNGEGPQEAVGQAAGQTQQVAGGATDQARQVAGQAGDAASQATGGQVREVVENAADEAGQAAEEAQDTAGRTTQQGQPAAEDDGAEGPRATNAARRRAEELGVDLSQVRGTGAGGLVTLKDVVGS